MDSIATYVSTAITVFLFIGGVLKFSVIDPLKTADKHSQERWQEERKELQRQADENKKNIGYIQEQLRVIGEKTIVDEINTRNGIERLNVLEDRVNSLYEQCRSCRK